MNQDINKIIDVINSEWFQNHSLTIKKLAVIVEENERLKQEIEQLKKSNEKLKNQAE